MIPIGDIARHVVLQRQSNNLRSMIQARSEELATGQVHDKRGHLSGETGRLYALTNKKRILEGYQSNVVETRTLFEAQQRGLDSIRQHLSDVIDTSLSTNSAGQDIDGLQQAAKRSFTGVMSTLMASVSGRQTYGGLVPSASPQAALDRIAFAISSNPSQPVSETIDTELSAIFGQDGTSAGHFPSAVPLSPTQRVELADQGMDSTLRNVLASLAAVAIEGGRSTEEPGATITGEFIMLQDSIVQVQSDLGQREGYLDRSEARNAAEIAALRTLRNDLVGADPYEAATELQSATLRLETLLTATARISKLNLANYLQ